ncbi:hypothetical protein BASA60_000765 [Batrachochytrium salamandrivorans]|nr:hypothetical protein BASA60_000765 [Batrachochytrium salamandrivorans]
MMERSDDHDDDEDLSAYHAPAPTSHVVVANYFPRNSDEMHLQSGDLIGIERLYKDGWARGQNISQSRKRCIFPLAIVTPIVSGPTQTVRKGRDNVWMGSTVASHGVSIEEQQQILMDQNDADKQALAASLLKSIPDRQDSLRRLHRNEKRLSNQNQLQYQHGKHAAISDEQGSLRSVSSDDSMKMGAVVNHYAV